MGRETSIAVRVGHALFVLIWMCCLL